MRNRLWVIVLLVAVVMGVNSALLAQRVLEGGTQNQQRQIIAESRCQAEVLRDLIVAVDAGEPVAPVAERLESC